MESPKTAKTLCAFSVAFVMIQIAVPLARMSWRQPVPLSARFSWSMFAKRHACALILTAPDGSSAQGLRVRNRSVIDTARLMLSVVDDKDEVAEAGRQLGRYLDAVDPSHAKVSDARIVCSDIDARLKIPDLALRKK